MMSDRDLIDLYSGKILELASDIPNTRRLDAPDATMRKRSPLCGSTITVDLRLDGETIVDFGQDVRACALGQAAASVVGANIIGTDINQARKARDELRAMLAENGPTPSAPFEDLKVLSPAREFKNRHSSILLALEAICSAADETRKAI